MIGCARISTPVGEKTLIVMNVFSQHQPSLSRKRAICGTAVPAGHNPVRIYSASLEAASPTERENGP